MQERREDLPALGGIIGIFLGRAFTSGISMLTNEPATITPEVIVKALIFAAGTGIVFGVYPARKSSSASGTRSASRSLSPDGGSRSSAWSTNST